MNPLLSWRVSKASPIRSTWVKRVAIALPLLCLLIFGTVIGAGLFSKASGASAASLMPIKGHIPALVKTSTLVGSADANQNISLSVGLKLRNEDSLKSYVHNMSRANSLTKTHLTSAQIATAYAPLASSQQSIVAYLQGYGFHVTKTLSQHLVISIQGTVGDAENAFHIQINNYRSSKGQNFYAPTSEPMMPPNLAALVQNIAGLSNTVHFTHPPIEQQPKNTTHVSANSVTCRGTGSGYFLPSQFATAYNLQGFYNANLRGEGQSVALIEFDNFNMSDINNYRGCYGGSNVPINEILVDGGNNGNNAAPGPGAVEAELDMELILSAAPHLASLNVYEAPNSSAGSNDMWAQIINNDAVPVVSTSWGQCDTGALSSDLQEENSLFTIAAAQGQTIVASSGDEGTNDCQTFLPPNGSPKLTVDDPASQPFVTGVGGTTLAINSDNTYKSETVWNNGVETVDANNDQLVIAGGGGISSIWPMPSWQQGPGVNNSFSSGTPCKAPTSTFCREVPDVSLNADPNNGGGYLIFCTVAASGCTDSNNDTFFVIGGTSAAAPMWAAFAALTNEKTVKDGGFNIGFMNPFLYQIDQNAGGTSYANDFHDVTVGNNDGLNDNAGVYPATAAYDMASGLGSYNAWNLGQDLEKLANAKNGSRSAPASTTWYFAQGGVGNSFHEYLIIFNPSTQNATVTVTYLYPNGNPPTVKKEIVPPGPRFSIDVNAELGVPVNGPFQTFSTTVSSDVPIIVDRPMYFNLNGVQSGTDMPGATSATTTTFYFAQGDSTQSSSSHSTEFITAMNPSSTATAHVTATFYSNGQVAGTDSVTIPPMQRGNLGPHFNGQAAIQVKSDSGIVVERSIYFNNNIPSIGGSTPGATADIGATSLGSNNTSDWLFADGYTGPGFQEYLVLANFTQSDTPTTVKLEYTNGTVQNVPVTVKAQSQLYFDVNNANAHPNCSPNSSPSCTVSANVSAEVTAPTASIVAERLLCFHNNGAPGCTDIVGEQGPSSHAVYSLSDVYTGPGFEQWLMLLNPNSHTEVVAITFFADNTIVQKEITLPATSRTSILLNSIVTPLANAYPNSAGFGASLEIQTFDSVVNGQTLKSTIIVESGMYFRTSTPGGFEMLGYSGG